MMYLKKSLTIILSWLYLFCVVHSWHVKRQVRSWCGQKESVYNEMLNGFRCMLLHCTIKSARIAALRVVVHAA